MATIAIASLNYLWSTQKPVLFGTTIWPQLLIIALVNVLASRSDTARKLREELALIAYGGSGWQVWLRYFVRGLSLTLVAIGPLLYVDYASPHFQLAPTIILAFSLSAIGGACFAAPGLARIRSRQFAESYKG